MDHTEDFDRYRHLSACFTCPLRPRCTPTQRRIIKRWENEDVLDRMQARLDRMPEALGVRPQTVEPPFATLSRRSANFSAAAAVGGEPNDSSARWGAEPQVLLG